MPKREKKFHTTPLNPRLFKSAVENISDQLVITDTEGRLRYCNKAMEKITGYNRFKVLGKTPGKLWGGHMPAAFYKKMWKIIAIDKKEFVGTVKNRRKNGEEYFAKIKIAPSLDARGKIKFFVGIEQDITRQQMLDEAKNNFIRIASHQLRTPITAIYWITDSLVQSLRTKKLSQKDQRYLRDLSVSTHRMVQLVEDLLNLSRIQGLDAIMSKRFSPYAVLHEIIASFRANPEFKKRNIIIKRTKAAQARIASDETIVKNILQILLSNALDYSTPGSHVTVAIEKQKGLTVSVANLGPSILPSEHDHIFTMFFRGEAAKKARPDGSGIGLYTAKTMADKLKAQLSFQSFDGKTTFTLALPAKK